MLLPGGGGLKRMVCQLVDCRFCDSRSKPYLPNEAATYLEVICRDLVILINGLGEDDQRISNEEMSYMARERIVDAMVD